MIKKVVISIFVLLLFSMPAEALMKGLSTEELTGEADVIIEGDVMQVSSYWNDDHTSIYTEAVVVVNEPIKGSAATLIRVRHEGGEVGNVGLKISDMESFQNGERVLVFLKSDQNKIKEDVYVPVGKAQGKYRIDHNGIARKHGFSLAYDEDMVDNDIPVSVLKDRIRRNISRTGN